MRWAALLLPVCLVTASVAGEVPPPDSDWRLYRLQRCNEHAGPAATSEADLAEALDLFHLRNGGDAASVLEAALAGDREQPWLRLLLAQIYLLAGQGEPHCQPSSGPVAPTGDWTRDQRHWLDRAEGLLAEVAEAWPDDGLVEFLRADVARAAGRPDAAAEHDHRGRGKCSHRESLQFVQTLRDLTAKSARVLEPIVPVYPEECVHRGIEGLVVLDLLIDPQGRAVEVAVVGRADRRLAAAARTAAEGGGYQAAQLGYYPVWAWLRVPVQFTLEN